MRYTRLLVALIVVGVPLMMLGASSAVATVLTSPSGTEYTGSFKASATGSLLLKAGFAEITCTGSTVGGTVETNTTVAKGKVTEFTFSGCGSTTVDVLSKGSFEIASGGVMKAIGSEVTTSALGTSCVYGGGSGTTLGTLTGGTTAHTAENGGTTKFSKISGGFLCASPAESTGKYTVTTPDTLLID